MRDFFYRAPDTWTPEHARDWYQSRPRPFGVGYMPSYACNATEMWMPETFNLDTIRRELRWAGEAGFNCVRVFLSFCEWKRQQYAFIDRLEILLDLARSSGLTVIPVLFDDRNPHGIEPYDGWQPEPRRLLRNSSWTPTPGSAVADSPERYGELRDYVTSLVGTYREDERILFWDMYNEPGAGGRGSGSLLLLECAFCWARACRPIQPLTAAQWSSSTENGQQFCEELCLILSDFVSLHWYGDAPSLAARLDSLKDNGLPIVCTEWFARTLGETYRTCLPVFAERDVGCVQWGFVNGRSQSHIPPKWDADLGEPEVWYQDNILPDGSWYNELEKRPIAEYGRSCGRQDSRENG